MDFPCISLFFPVSRLLESRDSRVPFSYGMNLLSSAGCLPLLGGLNQNPAGQEPSVFEQLREQPPSPEDIEGMGIKAGLSKSPGVDLFD